MKTLVLILRLIWIMCIAPATYTVIDLSYTFAHRFGVTGLVCFWSCFIGSVCLIAEKILTDAIVAVEEENEMRAGN